MKNLVFVIPEKWNYGFNNLFAIRLINIQIPICGAAYLPDLDHYTTINQIIQANNIPKGNDSSYPRKTSIEGNKHVRRRR